MAQTINLGKPINPISDLENIGCFMKTLCIYSVTP